VSDKRKEAEALIGEMLPGNISSSMMDAAHSGEFGVEIGELAFQNVFMQLWTRPGLDRRSRSLVTLGILIALRAHDELEIHLQIALKNGLTLTELEEVLYHASGYAGFPAANSARSVALKTFRNAGSVD
jgi:4-carboxymuconolactone decarboxylase